MKPLRIENFGDDCQGIRLEGDPSKRPEPVHVRIMFPGGDVDVVRTTDNEYWVHLRVDSEDDVGVAGARLRAHLGLHRRTYLRLERVNLLTTLRWSAPRAREAATRLDREPYDVLVLLGSRVRAAFGVSALAPFEVSAAGRYVSLPHPSGRNLQWNDPRAAERARELLRGAAPWVPWGEALA